MLNHRLGYLMNSWVKFHMLCHHYFSRLLQSNCNWQKCEMIENIFIFWIKRWSMDGRGGGGGLIGPKALTSPKQRHTWDGHHPPPLPQPPSSCTERKTKQSILLSLSLYLYTRCHSIPLHPPFIIFSSWWKNARILLFKCFNCYDSGLYHQCCKLHHQAKPAGTYPGCRTFHSRLMWWKRPRKKK